MQIYHNTEETLSAETFFSVLNDDYESVFLTDCVIEGPLSFSTASKREDTDTAKEVPLPPTTVIDKEIICIGCTFKNSVKLENIHFQKEVFFANSVFKEAVHFSGTLFETNCEFADSRFEGPIFFRGTRFHGTANFRQTHCQQTADFNKSEFQKTLVFRNSIFKDIVRFNNVIFSDGIDFVNTRFSETTIFSRSEFLGTIDFTSARFAVTAAFEDISYVENTIWKRIHSRSKKKGEYPTEFYLDSMDINEVLNPFFKRYVADQQFIRAFKERHPFWAQVWRWSSDYGRSLGLWALWSLLIALSFACLYILSPVWVPTWLHPWRPQFHQVTGTDVGLPLTFWTSFYFSIVTFTTLGFGDVVADNTLARILVTLEVIFGYVMLGGLISIFANKLASRS